MGHAKTITMEAVRIERGQIWKSKSNDCQVEIIQKKGGTMWKARKLTSRTGRFNGTHTLNERTLKKGFIRLE